MPGIVDGLVVVTLSGVRSKPCAQRRMQVGVRELTAASGTLQPSITDFQGAVMIADVKGFTQLTEILSKTGLCAFAFSCEVFDPCERLHTADRDPVQDRFVCFRVFFSL